MGLIFAAFQSIPESKNLICMAHYEEYKDKAGDSLSYRFKSIGNMTDAYITPEGKFDIILYGKQSYDESTKTPIKQFVTSFDGEFPAKDSLGVLDNCPMYIPNDLGLVIKEIDEYYKK